MNHLGISRCQKKEVGSLVQEKVLDFRGWQGFIQTGYFLQ